MGVAVIEHRSNGFPYPVRRSSRSQVIPHQEFDLGQGEHDFPFRFRRIGSIRVLKSPEEFGFIHKLAMDVLFLNQGLENGDREMGLPYSTGSGKQEATRNIREGLDVVDGTQLGLLLKLVVPRVFLKTPIKISGWDSSLLQELFQTFFRAALRTGYDCLH